MRGQVMSQAWDQIGGRLGSYLLTLSKTCVPFMSPTVEKQPELFDMNYIWKINPHVKIRVQGMHKNFTKTAYN